MGCQYYGHPIENGGVFMAEDGCNRCVCTMGEIACTLMACPSK